MHDASLIGQVETCVNANTSKVRQEEGRLQEIGM